MLESAGYSEISERSAFKGQLKTGGKYYSRATIHQLSLLRWVASIRLEMALFQSERTATPHLEAQAKLKNTSAGYQQLDCKLMVAGYGTRGLTGSWHRRSCNNRNPNTNEVKIRNIKIDNPSVGSQRWLCSILLYRRQVFCCNITNRHGQKSPCRGTGTKLEINTEQHLPAVIASVVKAELGGIVQRPWQTTPQCLDRADCSGLGCEPGHIETLNSCAMSNHPL